jgi:octopine/nopaline transport system substrate-binding protein
VNKTLASIAAGMALFAAASVVEAPAAQAQTKVRIATEGAYMPWNGLDASGKLIGFEIDLSAELCKRIGATCEVMAQDWDGIIPGLQSRKYDLIMAGMSITDERKQVISFAGPYATEPTVFAAMKGSPLLALNLPTTSVDMSEISPDEQKLIDQSAAAVKGKTVGVQVSTIQQNMVEQLMPGVEVRAYDKVDNMGLDLVSGRIDAIVADRSAIEGLIKAGEQNKDITKFGPAFARGVLGEGVGVGLRKADTELQGKLDKAIKDATADGTITKLSTQWFGYDTSIK